MEATPNRAKCSGKSLKGASFLEMSDQLLRAVVNNVGSVKFIALRAPSAEATC